MRDIKGYARFARELLETVADGIGKLEGNANRIPAMLPDPIRSRIPRRYGGRRGTSMGTKLLVAGVAVSTAALIYAKLQSGRRPNAWTGVGGSSAGSTTTTT